jgi:hypothetical protein
MKKWILVILFIMYVLLTRPLRENKRKVFDNFLTPDECKRMIRLIKQKVDAGLYRQRQDNENGEQQIFDMHEFKDKQVNDIRRRVDNMIKTHFDKNAHIESSYMKVRVAGKSGFAHPPHVDTCEYDIKTKKCPIGPKSDHWLSHSVLIYLNSCDGGDFFFDDGKVVKPEPGRMLAFTSGTENVHGVNRIKRGDRYAIAIWFTKDKDKIEQYARHE